MAERNEQNEHPEDTQLWRWQSQELDERSASAVARHLQECPSCSRRAAAVQQLVQTMRSMHHAVQPTLAQQMSVFRALEEQTRPVEPWNILEGTSRRLLRWLSPALAVLALLFVLLGRESAPPQDALAMVLPDTPESYLLVAASDEQLQEAIFEVALSYEQNGR